MAVVTVEEVSHRREWRRFLDLPIHLRRGEPGWVAPLATLDRWILDPVLNPALADASVSVALLARSRGRPAGRIAVHVVGDRATFSHLAVPVDDDGSILNRLLERAQEMASEEGVASLHGPIVPGDPTDPGLRVGAHGRRAGVGLPWSPPGMADRLQETGAIVEEATSRWRAPLEALTRPGVRWRTVPGDVPPPYRAWADDRLVVTTDVARSTAVPDVVGELAEVGVRGAWRAAKRARAKEWSSCAVAELGDAPEVAVPALAAAAARAGYHEIVTPWGGEPTEAVPFARVTWRL